jgi:type II secretory pathway pseudopilin PulG
MGLEQLIQTTDGAARRAGFTLLEGLMASVVLAILVLGVFGSISTSYQESQAVRASSTAVTLGRQLTDEIVSHAFYSGSLGPGGLTSRSQYTDVSNYNGYSDVSDAMPLLAGGTLDVTGSDVYSRQASVVIGAKPSIDVSSPSTDFGIVTVNVTCPDGQVVSIPEFVAKYAISGQ